MGAPTIPVNLNGVSTDVVVTQANTAWGEMGSGSMQFWELWSNHVFRDSVARSVNAGQLQALDGYYPVLSLAGLQYVPKGDTEARSRDEKAVGLLGTTLRCSRIDSKAKPVPLRPGFDPTGTINSLIMQGESRWAMHLPQQVMLHLLVNNTDIFGNTAALCYDGKALFATDHPVNQNDKKMAGKTYSNIINLTSQVTEADWAKVRDQMRREVLDFDGVTLYNGAMAIPTVVVASDQQAMRWMRFIGGKDVFLQYHLQPVMVAGQPIGISSVSLGSAQIIVDPYLYQIASDKTAIDLTAFVFPNIPGNRKALIYREEQTPMVRVSGETDWPAHNQRIKEVVSDAYVVAGPGEPRSVYKVVEKAA